MPGSAPTHTNLPDAPRALLSFGASTPERSAMRHLLQRTNAVALAGPSGVGKTTILHAVASRAEIRAHFPDAIYIFHCRGRLLSPLIRQLVQFATRVADADFVRAFRAGMLDHATRRETVLSLVQFLQRRRMLLIFDDVAHAERDDVALLFDMILAAVGAAHHSSVKILFATPAMDASPAGATVQLRALKTGDGADWRMLSWYAADSPTSVDRHAFDDVLRRCDGLPLALCVAGTAVRHRRNRRKRSSCTAWEWYSLKMAESIRVIQSDFPHSRALCAAVAIAVEGLTERWQVTSIDSNQVFRSLCVMPPSLTMPVQALARMWNLPHRDAENIVQLLRQTRLVSVQTICAYECVTVHALTFDICVHLVQLQKESVKWHERLIQAYADQCLGKAVLHDRHVRPWWDVNSADMYIHDNLVRHLLAARRIDETLELLMDYRWIQRINDDDNRIPFQDVVYDLQLLQTHLTRHHPLTHARNIILDLRIIVQNMELCIAACLKNRKECTYQLYGRLSSIQSRSKLIQSLIWSIERYATRPWARPAAGILNSVGSNLDRVIQRGNVRCMENGLEIGELLLGLEDGRLIAISVDNGWVRWRLASNVNYPTIAICTDGKSAIYACSANGRVTVWEHYRYVRYFDVAQLNDAAITCMKLMENEHAVIGLSSGRLLEVDVQTGTTIKQIDAHEKQITSLECTSDLKVISSSDDCTARIWDLKMNQPKAVVLNGHSKRVNDVAINDRQVVATVSDDKHVRLWKASSGREVGSPLVGHRSGVNCALFSGDGDRLFSGSHDEIRVWQMESWGGCSGVVFTFRDADMKRVKLLQLGVREARIYEFGGCVELFAAGERCMVVWNLEEKGVSSRSFAAGTSSFAVSGDEKTVALAHSKTIQLEEGLAGTHENRRMKKYKMIFRVPVGDRKRIRGLAVSNDRSWVAYLNKEFVITVVDMSTKLVVYQHQWLKTWLERENYRGGKRIHISVTMGFDVNASHLNAEIRMFNSTDGSEIGKQIVCDVRGGSLIASSDEDDIVGTIREIEERETPVLFCTSELQHGLDVEMEDAHTRCSLGGLERVPRSTYFNSQPGRLWILNQDYTLHRIDLVTRDSQLASARTARPSLPPLS